MPAILKENNLTNISENLAQSFKKSEKENFENPPAPTVKQVLSAKIEYEEVPRSSINTLNSLQSKYILLKPNQAPLNVHHANSRSTQSSPSEKNINGSSTSASSASSTNSKLPQPKRVLFPKEKIQIGWNQNGLTSRWNAGCGFNNIGNTCYLNSALQAFFHVPSLAQWLISDKEHREKCNENCIICAMTTTLIATQRQNYGSFTPSAITSRLSQICRHLRLGHQEDAHEFLRYLIEKMEKSFLSRFRNEPWFKDLEQYSKETTPLNQILGGYLRSTVTCLACRYESVTFQHFQDLPLDISKVQTLNEAIAGYFSRENLEECGYKCEACKKKVSASKKFSLERAPTALCIQLKRFTAMGGKMSKHIQISEKLNLQKYMTSDSNQNCLYRLVSMITHLGGSSGGGHYTAVGIAPNGQFYHFDDCRVSQTSLESVLRSNSYVLFYELIQQSKNCESSMHNGHSIFHENGHTYVKNGIEMNGNGYSSSKYNNGSSSYEKIRGSDSSFSRPQLPSKLIPANLIKSQSQMRQNENASKNENGKSFSSLNGSPLKSSSSQNGISNKRDESTHFHQDQKNDIGIKRLKIERSPLPSVPRLIDESDVIHKSPLKQSIAHLSSPPVTPSKVKSLVPYESDDEEDQQQLQQQQQPTAICKTSSGIFIETDLRDNIKATPSKQGSTIITKAFESKSNENITNGKVHTNGTVRNGDDPLTQLQKLNHSGYGSQNVKSWSDKPSSMHKEVARDQNEDRKRHLEDEEADEMDRGRVKKLKYGNGQRSNSPSKGKLPNPFNEHQNMLNNGHERYYERPAQHNGYQQNRSNNYYNNNNNSKKMHFNGNNRNFHDRPSHYGYQNRQNFYKNNNSKKNHFNRNYH